MTNSSAATVLVVDDEPSIRDIVRRYLEAEGLRVVEAADGETALRLFAEQRPNVVVLDVGLPLVDGIDVLRQVRATSATPVALLMPTGMISIRPLLVEYVISATCPT